MDGSSVLVESLWMSDYLSMWAHETTLSDWDSVCCYIFIPLTWPAPKKRTALSDQLLFPLLTCTGFMNCRTRHSKWRFSSSWLCTDAWIVLQSIWNVNCHIRHVRSSSGSMYLKWANYGINLNYSSLQVLHWGLSHPKRDTFISRNSPQSASRVFTLVEICFCSVYEGIFSDMDVRNREAHATIKVTSFNILIKWCLASFQDIWS